MAQRRMFAKTIIDSDAFLDMPLSAQSLYFHLSMRADDDGFVNNPRKIQRMIGSNDDELKLLISKRFVIVFDSGVIVIKHWKIHNYIRADRHKPTVYQEELEQLVEKENKSYRLANDPKNVNQATTKGMTHGAPNDRQATTNRQPSGSPKDVTESAQYALKHDNTNDNELGIPDVNQVTYQMDTQVRLGKDRLGKVNSTTSADATKNYQKVFAFFENNFGVMKPSVQDALKDYTEIFESADMVIYAMQKAVDNQANFGYAKSILQRWLNSKLMTIEDVKADEVAFANRNKKMNQNKQPQYQEPVPEWLAKQQNESPSVQHVEPVDQDKQDELRQRMREMGILDS